MSGATYGPSPLLPAHEAWRKRRILDDILAGSKAIYEATKRPRRRVNWIVTTRAVAREWRKPFKRHLRQRIGRWKILKAWAKDYHVRRAMRGFARRILAVTQHSLFNPVGYTPVVLTENKLRKLRGLAPIPEPIDEHRETREYMRAAMAAVALPGWLFRDVPSECRTLTEAMVLNAASAFRAEPPSEKA